MTLGQRLQQARKAAKLTQEQLGTRTGIRKQTISDWETGRVASPDAAMLHTVARELKVTVDWLLAGEARYENDDDPRRRYPDLAAALELVHYPRVVVDELLAWAGLAGAKPKDVQGWLRRAKEIAEAKDSARH